MTKVATRPARPGAVIKEELFSEHGFCRDQASVLLDGTTSAAKPNGDEVTLLLVDDGDGTWSPVANAAAVAALTTEALAVLVDTAIYDESLATTPTDRVDTGIFTRGPAVVSVDNLKLGDGSFGSALSGANKTILVDLFKGQNIKNSDAL